MRATVPLITAPGSGGIECRFQQVLKRWLSSKGTACSSRGPESESQHPRGDVQLNVAPSSGLYRHQAAKEHRDSYTENNSKNKIKQITKRSLN